MTAFEFRIIWKANIHCNFAENYSVRRRNIELNINELILPKCFQFCNILTLF